MSEETPVEGPGGASPPPPPSNALPRSRGPLLAILGIVIIVVAAVLSYGALGYEYSKGRLNSAKDAYSGVIAHVPQYTDAVNASTIKLIKTDLSTATTADLQQNRTAVTQFITSSQQAQGHVVADDAAVAKASDDLQQNQWLTVISKSNIDQETTRIGHLRKALIDVKVVTADYVQLGTFYESFYDMLIDFDALGSQSSASALSLAVAKIKTDGSKAMSLDKAPGLPPEMDAFLKDVQTAANDFTALLAAAAAGDQAGTAAANTAVQNDASKLDAYDFSKMANTIDAFYKPMIDDYSSELKKAGNT